MLVMTSASEIRSGHGILTSVIGLTVISTNDCDCAERNNRRGMSRRPCTKFQLEGYPGHAT